MSNSQVPYNYISLLVNCVACPTRGTVRGDPEQSLYMLLAGGWVLVHRKKQSFACPRHNPSRVEFVERKVA
jgi:hypothetical protein